MKWIGLVVAILAAWLLKECWFDPVEGKMVRPIAVLVIVGGVVAYFEGLKREIILVLQQKDRDGESS
jgi:hypothetical protein